MPIKAPQPGDDIRADWGKAVSEAANASQIVAGSGITVQRTRSGSIISAAPEWPETRRLSKDATVLAVVTGGDSVSGYAVTLYAHGLDQDATGTGTLFIPECASDLLNTLPAATTLIAHRQFVAITGGSGT